MKPQHHSKPLNHKKRENHSKPTLFVKVVSPATPSEQEQPQQPSPSPEQQDHSKPSPLPIIKNQLKNSRNTKHKQSRNHATRKRSNGTKFTQLPCELLLSIVEYLEMNQFIHILLLNKTVTNKLNENSQFYKLILICTMKKDISTYRKYLDQRSFYNNSPFAFDVKTTCFKARGVCQWKHLIEKREHELENHLTKKHQTGKDWKQVYHGYARRRSIESIMFRVETISKVCWSNENSLILVLKLITLMREKLLKMDPELRKYIVQRSYGKRIKRGHTLFHQIVYLMGNYSFIRFDNEKIQPFIPHLRFLIGCFGNENPLFTRNSYNYSGIDYVIRVGNYSLISDLVNTYSNDLINSDLSYFVRKPLLFSMIKNKISSSVIKSWIQSFEFPKSVLQIKNHRQLNILHYMCRFVFTHGTNGFNQYLTFLASELSSEELLTMLNQKDENGQTPMSALLSYCEKNQANARLGVINWKNLNRLYGLVNMMAVHLGYDMSSEEFRMWNNLLENNDATFGNSYARFYLSEETIDMLRSSKSI